MTRPVRTGWRGNTAFAQTIGIAIAGSSLPVSIPAFAADPAASVPEPTTAIGPDINLELDVVARALDLARGEIQPSLGATVYQLQRPNIEAQPQGDNAPANQLLLQAPGVAQDSFGQLHVRGDHGNLQFRINGVQLPEGINVFGQALQTRLANSVSLITGALPAQYGFRTAGIIDIQTKTGDAGARRLDLDVWRHAAAGCSRASNMAGVSARSIISSLATTSITPSASRTPPRRFNALHDAQRPAARLCLHLRRRRPDNAGKRDPRHLAQPVSDPEQSGSVAGAGAHGQRRQRFQFEPAQRKPARDHPLRHPFAAKEARRHRFSGLGLQPIFERLFFPRPAWRFAVQRHRPDRLSPQRRYRTPG